MSNPTLKQQTTELFNNYNNINETTVKDLIDYWFNLVPGGGGIITGDLTIIGKLTQKTALANQSASLGPELTAASTWTSTNWTGSYGAGFAHTPGNVSPLSYNFTPIVGRIYAITFTVTGRTAGNFTVTVGGASSTVSYIADGQVNIVATGTGNLIFTPSSAFDGTISNISMKLLTTLPAIYEIDDSTGAAAFQIRSNAAANDNNYIGIRSGQANTTGQFNTAYGVDALSMNMDGGFNVAIGADALLSNTSGGANVAIGVSAMYFNSIGGNNVAVGGSALNKNNAGNNNTAIGTRALLTNDTGSENVALGHVAMSSNISGINNTALGGSALFFNLTGTDNVAVGINSLLNITTSNNVAVGSGAGRFITGGSTPNTNSTTSIYVGRLTKAFADTQSNEVVIGDSATGHGSNTITIGNTSVIGNYFTGPIQITPVANLPHLILPISGVPSPLADGMVWREDNTNTGMKVRVNGVTKTFTLI